MPTPAPSYYIYPDIEALATATGEERQRHIRRIAACVGDVVSLRAILGLDPEEFAEFYPDLHGPNPTTVEAIDTFLDRFGRQPAPRRRAEASPRGAAAHQGVVPVAPPAIDYAETVLAAAPAAPAEAPACDATLSAIDAFLGADAPGPARTATAPSAAPTPAAAPEISEAAARLLIKARDYQAALEIITQLSLKNPKKSIYFADQIRFLKKLIANTSGPKREV